VRIFLGFLRLGCSAFGGPAMVPYIKELAVARNAWCSEQDFRVGVALIQTLPGATAMQTAAWVGLRAHGLAGGLAAYLGFALPAFAMLLLLSALYAHYRDVALFTSAFAGLKAVVVAVVGNAAVNFSRSYCLTLRDKILALAAGLWLGFKLSPILAIVGGCLIALLLYRKQESRPQLLRETTNRRLYRLPLLITGAVLALGALALLLPHTRELIWVMLKIDIFAFGGGYVSMPLLLHEVVEARHWMQESTFMDGIALGQITPGPIVMTATFVGYLTQGVAGACAATLAVFTPSFLVLCACAPFVDKVLHHPLAQRVLHGSLVVLVGLMAAMTGRFVLAVSWQPAAALLAVAAFTALRLGLDVLYVVLAGGLLAMLML